MVHLRLVVPSARTKAVLDLLGGDDSVCNVVVLPGAAVRPNGDLVLCDVAREDASVVVGDLRELGLERDGSIAIERIDTMLSRAAGRAIRAAEGEEADAVLWEEVEHRTSEEASLSWSFLAFMLLAAGIAVSGIFTDSPILIVGAMVVSPDFGPLAGVCVAVIQRRRGLALRSLVALILGFPAAMVAGWALAEVLIATGAAPQDFTTSRGIAALIASPDAFTFVVAACAGVAGMLSLSTSKSGALIGVLISVTTIPAAAEVGVAAAISDWSAAGGAAVQLVANLCTIIVAGTLTLAVQRAAYVRRRRHHERARARRGR